MIHHTLGVYLPRSAITELLRIARWAKLRESQVWVTVRSRSMWRGRQGEGSVFVPASWLEWNRRKK